MADDCIEVEGKIVSVLPGTMFKVELSNGHQVLGHISGKLRKHFIKIGVGDFVKMEMSPYDLEKARIVFRLKTNEFGGMNSSGRGSGHGQRRESSSGSTGTTQSTAGVSGAPNSSSSAAKSKAPQRSYNSGKKKTTSQNKKYTKK